MSRALSVMMILLGFGGAMLSQWASAAEAAGPHAALMRIEDAIQPSSSRFLARGIDTAVGDGAGLLVVELDTPGGLFDSTRDMVESILQSAVPVVVYVTPAGAHAASAGTFITAAAHVAAMAPVTNIGAASPVGGGGQDLPETLEAKVSQDAAAFLRDIARDRGRNVEALEATVLGAKSYSASEALEMNVVDIVAVDLDDLMAQLDGRTVHLEDGDVVLQTAGLEIVRIEKTVLEGFLSFLANPTIAFALLALGFLGIFLEFILGLGTILPGIMGVVLLVLAFVAAGQLPVNWAGVALIGAAAVLFYFEIAAIPGTTVFGVLGVVAFAVGGLLLFGDFVLPGFERQPLATPSFRVSPWLIAGASAALLAVLLSMARILVGARAGGTSVQSAAGSVVGQTGVVTAALAPSGFVHVAGEDWSAFSDSAEPIETGREVVVVEEDGLTLKVFVAPDSTHE